ncbi:MAG: peptidoglycan-binding protein, partial [Candidatus Rokuibacteriota bacterium]
DTPEPSAEVLHVPLRSGWQGATLDRGKPRTLVLLPSLVCVRLTGLNFDTSKSFVLPGAMRGIRRLREIYEEHPDAKLVVCGHTDTAGSKKYNLDLSLERAESLIAFLTDRVDAWEAWFQQGKPDEKRWGTREIQHMLKTLPSPEEPYYAGGVDGDYGPGTRGGVERFQEDHGLAKTGKVDAATRRAIITDYMAIDGTSLPADAQAEPHGCGEFFRAAETGDAVALAENRRVDVFFFDGPVHPPNPGPHATEEEAEYAAWRDRSRITHRLDTDGAGDDATPAQIRVLLHSNSGCVPLADRPYRIDVDGKVHEGVTDAEGLALVSELHSGDYDLEVEGTKDVV